MFLGTTSDHDHAYWRGLIDQGISDHVRGLDEKHPGWETWSRRFVGNHEDGYFTSDIKRAMGIHASLTGTSYEWRLLRRNPKHKSIWHTILKFRAPLLVVGMATEREVRGDKRALEKAECWRGGILHAICIRDGKLLDPGLRGPMDIEPNMSKAILQLRGRLRRIVKVYHGGFNQSN